MVQITPSSLLTAAFITLSLAVACGWLIGLAWACRATGVPAGHTWRVVVTAAAATALWMILVLVLAAQGVLLHFDWHPPPLFVLLATVIALGAGIALSPLGARLAAGLPLAALVGFQAFRWPLEWLMHRGFVEGFVPVQMTYVGRNFDVVTGITALALGLALLVRPRLPLWIVAAWNVLGTVLLVNILVIAVLSTPPIRFFGPDRMNVWVAVAPFVWLPAVLVTAAVAGHLVIFRQLRGTVTL